MAADLNLATNATVQDELVLKGAVRASAACTLLNVAVPETRNVLTRTHYARRVCLAYRGYVADLTSRRVLPCAICRRSGRSWRCVDTRLQVHRRVATALGARQAHTDISGARD